MAVFNIPASNGRKAVNYTTRQMSESGNIRVRFPNSADVNRVIGNTKGQTRNLMSAWYC